MKITIEFSRFGPELPPEFAQVVKLAASLDQTAMLSIGEQAGVAVAAKAPKAATPSPAPVQNAAPPAIPQPGDPETGEFFDDTDPAAQTTAQVYPPGVTPPADPAPTAEPKRRGRRSNAEKAAMLAAQASQPQSSAPQPQPQPQPAFTAPAPINTAPPAANGAYPPGVTPPPQIGGTPPGVNPVQNFVPNGGYPPGVVPMQQPQQPSVSAMPQQVPPSELSGMCTKDMVRAAYNTAKIKDQTRTFKLFTGSAWPDGTAKPKWLNFDQVDPADFSRLHSELGQI